MRKKSKKATTKPRIATAGANVSKVADTPAQISQKVQKVFRQEAKQHIKEYGEGAAYASFCLELYAPFPGMSMDDYLADPHIDGGGDMKVDFCHIDEDITKKVLIVQDTFRKAWGRLGQGNKADDFDIALSSLFSSPATMDSFSEKVKAKAVELQGAVRDGNVEHLDILFVHNGLESDEIGKRLNRVKTAAHRHLKHEIGKRADDIRVNCREIGLQTVHARIESRGKRILVRDEEVISGKVLMQEEPGNWKAAVVSVSAEWIRKMHKIHGEKLFSANFRGYLGVSARERDINTGIIRSAESNPKNFWVFNNGITALTRKIQPRSDNKDGIVVDGISIINGAQTTGAIAAVKDTASLRAAKVLLRVVQANLEDDALVDEIIQCNNTQNVIKPEDTRSNDEVLTKLSNAFKEMGITFVHRRDEQRPRNAIHITPIARALCSFHGQPQIAARRSRDIFEVEKMFKNVVFPSESRAGHIFLLHALSIAVDNMSKKFKKMEAHGGFQGWEKNLRGVLKYSTSAKYFLLFLIGRLSAEIFGVSEIPDKHNWVASKIGRQHLDDLVNAWGKVIQVVAPLLPNAIQEVGSSNEIENPAYEIPRSVGHSKAVAEKLLGTFSALLNMNETNSKALNDIRKMSMLVK